MKQSSLERTCSALITGRIAKYFCFAVFGFAMLLGQASGLGASVAIPNASFESPAVPPVSPYAGPDIDAWQKTPQPAWYDPHQNNDTPWAYLMGQFYNVPFPGQFIENAQGSQAAFLFAVPEAGLFQDYTSIGGTNTEPTHAFDAKFKPGYAYDLAVGVLGGGGGMKPGATIQLSLYYVDAASNKVTVASTTVTNTLETFPTNTLLVDFHVRVPTVNSSDAWAGKNIGIELLSTAGFDIAGGYWDLDNVRLTETAGPTVTLTAPSFSQGTFTFGVQTDPGARVEILAAPNLSAAPANWLSLGTLTNVSGTISFTNNSANFNQRFYRARLL